MAPEHTVRVELVYARPEAQDIVVMQLPSGATVRDAVLRSGFAARHPEIDMTSLSTGVYGRRVPVHTVLREGDRIELYRPLLADPKGARRRRAAS